MIRVLIAEDQALVLGALAALLELEEDIIVVAQCADGQLALEQTLMSSSSSRSAASAPSTSA